MKKLLIVVDYQKDFVDGALGFDGAESLDAPICRKIEEMTDGDVVFTFDTHFENYLQTKEGENLPIPHCIKGTPGWELYGNTANYLDRAVRRFEKPSFGSMELADFIKTGQYQQIELVGLVSNICVLSNAVLAKAACPEADVIVDANCTAAADPQMHQKALDVLEGLQIQVVR